MMKSLFVLLFSFSAVAGTPCEVYGISDSPQALHCTMARGKVELSCREGVYYLNETEVEAAFHYEVEEGPVPLVFKTASEELVVTIGNGRTHKATLASGRKKSRGSCHL